MIGLHARKCSSKTYPYIQRVIDAILAARHKVLLFPSLLEKVHHFRLPETDLCSYSEANLRAAKAVFCVGGDGTMLEAVTYVRDSGIPLLGINTGRLGFLAYIAKDQIQEALSLFFSGRYACEERGLLALRTEEPAFKHLNFALNEFVILRRDLSSMIGVSCYVDDHFIGKFWADGLMVATPTGSTAYSLSCGGPVSAPTCQHFVLTPISPHNLSARPLIIPDTSRLSLEVESAARRVLISLDSRSATMPSHHRFCIYKENFYIRLIQIEGSHFFDTLREKMRWGVDIRK